jgi:oxaloacetate decarboxylase gamma subunit
MQRDIVAQGLELLLFGMGTVVLFLALLVLCTGVMSRLIARYFPEPPAPAAPWPGAPQPAAPQPAAPQPAAPQPAALQPVDPRLVAVIAAAVRAHRSRPR